MEIVPIINKCELYEYCYDEKRTSRKRYPIDVDSLKVKLSMYNIRFESEDNPLTELMVFHDGTIVSISDGNIIDNRKDWINFDCRAFAVFVLILQGKLEYNFVTKYSPLRHDRAFYLSSDDLSVSNTLPIDGKGQWIVYLEGDTRSIDLSVSNTLPIDGKGQWIVYLEGDKYIGMTRDSWKIMTLGEWAEYSHRKFVNELVSSTHVYSMFMGRDHYNWYLYGTDKKISSSNPTDLVKTGTKFNFNNEETNVILANGLNKLIAVKYGF